MPNEATPMSPTAAFEVVKLVLEHSPEVIRVPAQSARHEGESLSVAFAKEVLALYNTLKGAEAK